MYRGLKIGIVVPAFNEETLLEQTILNIPAYIDIIVIVDDCSDDQTYEIAKKMSSDRIFAIRREKNGGVGISIKEGHNFLHSKKIDISIVMAGDNQMDPSYIPNLLDAIVNCHVDYAKGNRFIARKGLGQMPKHRLFGNIILDILTRFSTGNWNVGDPENGFTAIKLESFNLLEKKNLQTRYQFEFSMLVELNRKKMLIKDVPIPSKYGDESSKLNLSLFIPQRLLLFVIVWFNRQLNWLKTRNFIIPLVWFGMFLLLLTDVSSNFLNPGYGISYYLPVSPFIIVLLGMGLSILIEILISYKRYGRIRKMCSKN